MNAIQPDTVFAALRAVGDVATSLHQRSEATQYIETCRKEAATLLVMKTMLESPQINGDSTWCFLCLKLFEDCLYLHWNSLEYSDQIEIRSFTCGLVDLCRMSLQSMPIRTKLAKIVSELAKRHYPQLWKSFIPDLLSSWTAPNFSLKAQVCAMSLEFLIEDCVDCNFNESLPAKRRNDILTELKNHDMVHVLDLSYNILSLCFGSLNMMPDTALTEKEELATAMNSILGMLAPMAILAKPADMTEPNRNFADVAVLLLRFHPLKERALELLSRVSRAGQLLSRDAFKNLLTSLPEILSSVYNSQPTTQTALDGHIYYGSLAGRVDVIGMDDLKYNKRLLDVATVALTSNIELLADRHDSDTIDKVQERIFQIYLEVIAAATIYISSRRMYFEVIKHWHKMFKTRFIMKLTFMPPIVHKILMMFVSSCSKVPWQSQDDFPIVTPYAKDEVLLAEFESSDEFLAHYSIYRATVSDIVKEAARNFPLAAATFAKVYLSFLLEKFGMLPIVSVSTEAYAELDSYVLYLEAICTSVISSLQSSTSELSLQSAEVAELGEVARLLLTWQPLAPLLVLNKLRFLSSISCVFNLSATLTSSCFEYLFQMMNYDCTSLKDDSIEDQVLQVRRRTTATISSLCSSVPILTKDPSLMEKIYTSASAFLQNSSVLHAQRTNMIETLIGLADKLPSVEARRGLIVSIMQDTVATITSREVGSIISSSADLLTYLTQCLGDSDKLAVLSNFKQAINSFVGACRKVSAPSLPENNWKDEPLGVHGTRLAYEQLLDLTPFGILWRDVLPVLCTALNTVLGVYTPAMRGHIEGMSLGGKPHPLTNLFIMSSYDIMDLTKAKIKPPAVDVHPVVDRVSSSFKELALSIYHAIGCAVWHKVIFLDEACHRVVTESLAAHVHCMENRQLRTVLKYIVQRYVLNLPRPGFSVGHPFIISFFENIRRRLEWINPSVAASVNHQAMEHEYQILEKSGNVLGCFQSEAMFNMYIYRKSGISSYFYQKDQFSSEQIDEARVSIITDLNRKLIDSFAAFFSVSDLLSVQHSVAEKERSKQIAQSPPHDRGKVVFAEDGIDDELSGSSSDKILAIRRACVNNFVFGPGRDALAALLLDLTLIGLRITDQVLMAKSIRIYQYLCSEQQSNEKHPHDSHVHGWTDERIAMYLGTTVFGACLQALISDERLLNLDFIALMEDIMTRFEPLRSRINCGKAANSDNAVVISEAEAMNIPPCAILARQCDGCSPDIVVSMCSSMCTQKMKKARRDTLKDVVTDIMMYSKGATTEKLNKIENLTFPVRADFASAKPVSVGLLDQVSSTQAGGLNGHVEASCGLTELFIEKN